MIMKIFDLRRKQNQPPILPHLSFAIIVSVHFSMVHPEYLNAIGMFFSFLTSCSLAKSGLTEMSYLAYNQLGSSQVGK